MLQMTRNLVARTHPLHIPPDEDEKDNFQDIIIAQCKSRKKKNVGIGKKQKNMVVHLPSDMEKGKGYKNRRKEASDIRHTGQPDTTF